MTVDGALCIITIDDSLWYALDQFYIVNWIEVR